MLIAGEAVALIAGVYLLGAADNPWIRAENDIFLVVDLVTGVLLVVLGLVSDSGVPERETRVPLVGSTLVAVLAHTYRGVAYLWARPNTFCASGALFLLNNVKLVGLGIILLGLLSPPHVPVDSPSPP
jgi:hypothetical protein